MKIFMRRNKHDNDMIEMWIRVTDKSCRLIGVVHIDDVDGLNEPGGADDPSYDLLSDGTVVCLFVQYSLDLKNSFKKILGDF